MPRKPRGRRDEHEHVIPDRRTQNRGFVEMGEDTFDVVRDHLLHRERVEEERMARKAQQREERNRRRAEKLRTRTEGRMRKRGEE